MPSASNRAAAGGERVSGTSSRVVNGNKPVINNTRSQRSSKPSANEEVKQGVSIPGQRSSGAAGTQSRPVANSQRVVPGATSSNQRGAPIVNNRGSKPVPPKPQAQHQSRRPNLPQQQQPASNDAFMDEDAINAAAIAAALDEDEGLALAEKLQNEAYTGGNLSARGAAAD